jgi:hypothetical protein
MPYFKIHVSKYYKHSLEAATAQDALKKVWEELKSWRYNYGWSCFEEFEKGVQIEELEFLE